MKRLFHGFIVGVGLGAAAILLSRSAHALAAKDRRPTSRQNQRPLPVKSDRDLNSTRAMADLRVRVTPEMIRYSYTRYCLFFVSTLVHATALCLLIRWKVGTRLRRLSETRTRLGLSRAYIFYPLFTLAYAALTFPLTLYSGFFLAHQYGLSNQNLGDWVLDGMRSFAVSAGVGPPVFALLYWTMKRSPKHWWFCFWLASLPIIVAATLLEPWIIEPLFNKVQPLQNERLRARILNLAREAGISNSRVFEVDASRRTRTVNAYVTGIGGSARIVLWDTLLTKLDEDEVLFVMAHEMGHYVERHVPLGVGAAALGSLLFFFLIDRTGRRILMRYGHRWEIRGLGDPASFPLLMLMVLLLNFVGSPIENAISRSFERRADAFGLRKTNDRKTAARAFIKLSEKNLSLPNPPQWVVWWMFSHPPLQERIETALSADT